MADPLSLAVLSASIAGLLMRGAAVAVDPSWGSAASLPSEALNAWRSLRRLQQGRGGQENPLEASIKARLQKQVDAASERVIRGVLHELRDHGATIVIVHHDLSTVAELCDHVTILNRGIIATGPTSEAFTRENITKAFGLGLLE